MSKFGRGRFRDYDEDDSYRHGRPRQTHRDHIHEKHLRNALRGRHFDDLLDEDDL